MSPLPLALGALGGALAWTLLEYVLHRWFGHDRRLARTAFGAEHARHHALAHAFGSTGGKLALAVVGVGLLAVPAVALGGGVGLGGVLGLVAAWLAYEVFHRLLHVWEGVGPYARWARAHHFHHHFEAPQANFGVTSPLWDLVFGTWRASGCVRVPRRLAMPWLLDPATGEVRPHLDARYVLRGPRPGPRRGRAGG